MLNIRFIGKHAKTIAETFKYVTTGTLDLTLQTDPTENVDLSIVILDGNEPSLEPYQTCGPGVMILSPVAAFFKFSQQGLPESMQIGCDVNQLFGVLVTRVVEAHKPAWGKAKWGAKPEAVVVYSELP